MASDRKRGFLNLQLQKPGTRPQSLSDGLATVFVSVAFICVIQMNWGGWAFVYINGNT